MKNIENQTSETPKDKKNEDKSSGIEPKPQEVAIGETITIAGIEYLCVDAEGEDCDTCDLVDKDCGVCDIPVHCCADYRMDGKDVKFIKK